MKIVIYREIFSLPDFNQSFNNISLEKVDFQLIDVNGINESHEIDQFLSEMVDEGKKEKPDMVFIPSIIGTPLSYYGVRLVMHWRLDLLNKELNHLPIVILGSENETDFFRSCDYSFYLKTHETHYCNYSDEAVKNFILNFVPKKDNEFDAQKELKYYNIDPPASYKSHHSIANEWSILRWAESLEISNKEIRRITNSISVSLYYKYLSANFPFSENEKMNISNFSPAGKVLYIDDEVEKGWNSIMLHIFKQNYTSFGNDFKSWSKEEIINRSIAEVRKCEPDIVILDLRLHDDDFDILNNAKELSGFKILESIKKTINPGIQVIIFTASNKVWNWIELQNGMADGFAIKESPEIRMNKNSVRDSIERFNASVVNCFRNIFLKKIWVSNFEIKKIIESNILNKKYFQRNLPAQINGLKYKILILNELDAITQILCSNNSNRFNLSMIMLYKILEYLNEIFFKKGLRGEIAVFYDDVVVEFFDQNDSSWKKYTDKIPYYENKRKLTVMKPIDLVWINSTINKILNFIHFRLQISEQKVISNIISLSNYRNDFIHSDTSKRNKLHELTSTQIVEWMESISQVIRKL